MRKNLFFIMLIVISFSLSLFLVSCATSSPQSVPPQALNPITETDSLLFGLIDPSLNCHGKDKERFERIVWSEGLLGSLLFGPENSALLSFKNIETQDTYNTKVPAHGGGMREFLIVLPKGTYLLSISSPLLKKKVTADKHIISLGARNAIYLGELELHIFQRDDISGIFLGCDLRKFEEKKDEFLKKYPQFMGKVVRFSSSEIESFRLIPEQ